MVSRVRVPKIAKLAVGGLLAFSLLFAAACADEDTDGLFPNGNDDTVPFAPADTTPDPVTPADPAGTPTPAVDDEDDDDDTVAAIDIADGDVFVLLIGSTKGTPAAA